MRLELRPSKLVEIGTATWDASINCAAAMPNTGGVSAVTPNKPQHLSGRA